MSARCLILAKSLQRQGAYVLFSPFGLNTHALKLASTVTTSPIIIDHLSSAKKEVSSCPKPTTRSLRFKAILVQPRRTIHRSGGSSNVDVNCDSRISWPRASEMFFLRPPNRPGDCAGEDPKGDGGDSPKRQNAGVEGLSRGGGGNTPPMIPKGRGPKGFRWIWGRFRSLTYPLAIVIVQIRRKTGRKCVEMML